MDRDFNINRLERYLTICHSSRVDPIVVLSKADLIVEPQQQAILDRLLARIKDIPIVVMSNETHTGGEPQI